MRHWFSATRSRPSEAGTWLKSALTAGTSLSGALLLSTQVATAAQSTQGESTAERDESHYISCTRLDTLPDDDAGAWFAHSLIAQRCYGFQAVALRLGMGSLRTFLFEHRIQNGVEQQRVQYLDGPAETVEHENRSHGLWWTDHAAGPGPASIDDTVSQLETLYDFDLAARDIVAGRKALVIDITPRDSLRFPRRLWVDLASGLPLRQQLLDQKGQVMDIVQVVRLDSLVRTGEEIRVVTDEAAPLERQGWRPDWLPEGFYRQPLKTGTASEGDDVRRQLYSDGLATLSIFVAPTDGQRTTLREGVHQLGNFRAAARFIEFKGRDYQVIAVGLMPAETLARVVASVSQTSTDEDGSLP